MSLNNVTVQPSPGGHATFQVHGIPRGEFPDGAAHEGLAHDVDAEVLAVDLCGREADAVDCDGTAQGEAVRGAGRMEPNGGTDVAVALNGQHLPLLGNNSGKHQLPPAAVSAPVRCGVVSDEEVVAAGPAGSASSAVAAGRRWSRRSRP